MAKAAFVASKYEPYTFLYLFQEGAVTAQLAYSDWQKQSFHLVL